MAELARAASRKESHKRAGGIEAVRAKEFRARSARADFAHQRMTHKLCRHGALAEELFFEREDAQGLFETPTHRTNPPGPPGPELRGHKINVADADAAKFARQAQVEAGKIHKDGEGRPAAPGFRHDAPHRAAQAPEIPHAFDAADDSHLR